MEITINVCRIPKWSEITQRDFSWDIGLFSGLAKNQNETERTITNMKDSGIALQMSWSPISKTAGIQFFRASSALIRRFFKKEGGKCTILFSGDTSSAEPVADWWMNWLSRFLVCHFSSMEKSIAKLNEQFRRKTEAEEVNTLVQTLETNVQAVRDRLRDHPEKFEKSSKRKVSRTCASTGFMREVSIAQYFRTNSRREMMVSEENRLLQRVYLVMTRCLSLPDGFVDTKIGPFRQVRVTCCLFQDGIEIQVSFMLKNGSSPGIVISRGPNR